MKVPASVDYTLFHIHSKVPGDMVLLCPATLVSHHFTPTIDAGTAKAKSAAY